MSRLYLGVFFLGLAMQTYAGASAEPESVPASLKVCVDLKDDALRLACFDRELARLSASPASAPATQAPATEAATLTAEERFGRQGGAVALEQSKREKATAPTIKELTSTVVALSTRPHGEIVMTLENGQVWSQLTYDAHFLVELHDKVTIRAAALGSFLLYGPSGRSTRVTRLR